MGAWGRGRFRWLLAAGASILIASGCGEDLGAPAMPTARVVGRIHFGGQPIGSGWIEFHPVDGTIGTIRSARIGPDGRFEAERVAVGENVVLLVNPPSRVGPNGLRDYGVFGVFTRYPIVRRTVGPNGPTALDIDLRDEYLAFRRAHPDE